MIVIIVGITIAMMIGMAVWMRRSGVAKKMSSRDKGERRRAYVRFFLVLTPILLFPFVAIIGSMLLDERLNYDQVEARVEGTERVCTVATRSARKGRDRWNDRTEPMPCVEALAQLPSFGDDARLINKERITYVFGGSGGERRGHVIWSDPPSPFRPGQRISVLHPKAGEGAGRRPSAL